MMHVWMKTEDIMGIRNDSLVAETFIANIDGMEIPVEILPDKQRFLFLKELAKSKARELGLKVGEVLIKRPQEVATTSEEAEELITQGWRFVGTLPNSKVILEKMP